MQFTIEIKVVDVEITYVCEKGTLDYKATLRVSSGCHTNSFVVRHTAYHKGKTIRRPEYEDYGILYVDLTKGLGSLTPVVQDDVEKMIFEAVKKKWAEIA
jgi:hypothetical protein